MTKAQMLNIMIHEGDKLFHVSVHNFDVKSSGVTSYYSRARYAYEQVKLNSGASVGRAMSAGLMIALINTDCKGWTDRYSRETYAKKQAFRIKRRFIAAMEAAGYANVGIRTIKNTADDSSGKFKNLWNVKFNVVNMKRPKIIEKVEWIGLSLTKTSIPAKVRENAYRVVVGIKPHSFEIDNMATLFRYVREELQLH